MTEGELESDRDLPLALKTTLELDTHRPLVSERLTEPPSELKKRIGAGFSSSPFSIKDEDMQTIEKEDRIRMVPTSNHRPKVMGQPRQHQSAQPSAFSTQPQPQTQQYLSINSSQLVRE